MVNDEPEKQPYNKHLLKPYKKGEIVKVAPFEEQVRNSDYDHMFKYVKPDNNPWNFRKRYVVIYRKDDEGKWTLKYTAGWSQFDLLTNKKQKMVMNRTEGLIVPKGRKYSEKELTEIVEGVINEAAKASEEITRHIANREFNKDYRKGRSERTHEELQELVAPLRPFVAPRHEEDVIDGGLHEGMEFDREKCEACDSREGCIVFAMIFGQDKEEDAEGSNDKPTEGEDTEKKEKDEEQAPADAQGHHKAPKEDEGK